jgi:8-oxo-dGTP pyrophosphatase MutT (NUDIX family)
LRQRWVRLSLTPLQRRLAAALATRTVPAHSAPRDTDEPWAAVAVILSSDPDSVLLIRRAERPGDPWSGHIGLPGGRFDRSDSDLVATALRETAEEIGYTLSTEGLLGALEDVWPRTPLPRMIVVRPYVFAVPSRGPVTPSPEVAEAFWVPLAELRHPKVFRDTVVSLQGEDRTFPGYHLAPGTVWGLTERILTSLLQVAI